MFRIVERTGGFRIAFRALTMFAVLGTIGISTMSGNQPLVTVTGLESEKLLLLSASSPGFEPAFQPGRLEGYDRLLPFTVVIKNESDQEVIAYSVVWNCRNLDGSVDKPVRSVFDFSDLRPGTHLPPRSTQIVSISTSLEAGGRAWDPCADKLIALYAKYQDIHIALDAAVFADGSSVGPDTSHWIPRWRAWIDAEKEVFTEATQSVPSETISIMHRMAEPGSVLARRLSSGELGHFTAFAVLADRSGSYAECLELARGYFASAIIEEIEHGGLPTIENLRSILRSKVYPDVHSKYRER
jgi:hypothetical protein